MLKYTIKAPTLGIIFCKIRIDTFKSLSVKLAIIIFAIFISFLNILSENSLHHHAHHTRWEVSFKVNLVEFGVVPAAFNKLIFANVRIGLLLNSQNSIFRWILIILHTLHTDIPRVITQIFDHNLDYIITV